MGMGDTPTNPLSQTTDSRPAPRVKQASFEDQRRDHELVATMLNTQRAGEPAVDLRRSCEHLLVSMLEPQRVGEPSEEDSVGSWSSRSESLGMALPLEHRPAPVFELDEYCCEELLLRPIKDISFLAEERAQPGQEEAAPAPVAATTPRARRAPMQSEKRLYCLIYISEAMLDDDFKGVSKIIGVHGCNTNGIYKKTGAKVRVRGRGSRHLENRGQEADVPLQLAITADNAKKENMAEAYKKAVDLLGEVSDLYCHQNPSYCGRLFWLAKTTKPTLECLRHHEVDYEKHMVHDSEVKP